LIIGVWKIFKYNLGQQVFYFNKNKIHSAKIFSRCFIENSPEISVSNKEQALFFNRFGLNKIQYATCHGEFNEENVFSSKEELLKSM
jgi:hypothetical protein